MSSEINVNILFYNRIKSSSYPIVNCLAGEERIAKATFPDARKKKKKTKQSISSWYSTTAQQENVSDEILVVAPPQCSDHGFLPTGQTLILWADQLQSCQLEEGDASALLSSS